jgi:hypothetical protein
MTRLFPVTVVAVDGTDVVLSQGGSLLTQGDVYDVVLRGKEVTDPQTGRVIGRLEKPCCTVLVSRVTADLSYATVVKSSMDIAAAFAPGALELRGPGRRPVAVAAEMPATNPQTAAQVAEVAKDGGAAQPTATDPPAKPKVDKDW